MFVDKIEEQHQEIKKILRELREDVYSEEDVSQNTLMIALKLGHLSAVLQMHLKFEDDYLYPCLTNSDHNEAKTTADRLIAEMGELSAKFQVYIQKYLGSPNTIREQTKGFVKETQLIVNQIFQRITVEENELYSLLNENMACNTKL